MPLSCCAIYLGSGGKHWLIVEDVRDMASLGSRILEVVGVPGLFPWALFCTYFGLKGLKCVCFYLEEILY